MKHFLNNLHRIHISRKAMIAAGLFFAVFGVSAASAYMIVPQTVIRESENSGDLPSIVDDHQMTGRERFISNLANSAANGMSITADKLVFEFDGKEEVIAGENNVNTVVSHTNRLDASGTSIDLMLSSLSLHGINLAVTAPVVYSDAGNNAHHRGLHASMIDSHIYLNLFDEGINAANPAWNFKYTVDASAYDEKNGDNVIIDPVTGGIKQYEYGELDWLIEDILAILSDGGIDVSLQGWLDGLLGGTSEEETAGPVASSEDTSSGISTDAIMSSMENMIETTHEGNPYFIWNLPLGSMNLELGMRSNDEFALTGIDLPARYAYSPNGEDDGYDFTLKENPTWEIQEGMRLSAQATIKDFDEEHDGWNQTLIPGDVSQYKELKDSLSLFRSVASYVAHPQFGVDVALDLGYSSEGKAGDRTHLKKEASSDSMRIALSADADLDERKFHGVSATASIEKMALNENNELYRKAGHDINLTYLYDQEEKKGDGYLDINQDYFKAHTTKVYLDEFYAEVLSDVFSGSSTEEKAEGSNTLNQVQEVLNTLGLSIDSILDSDFMKDFNNGVYVAAVDFIKSIRNDNNLIEVVLTLDPIGLEGEIVLSLRGTENRSDLLSIEIQGIRFASFTLNGLIKTRDFEALPTVASYEGKGYDDLCHLKGIGEQVTDIVHEKAFEANLGVSVGEDLAIDGDLAFAFTDEVKQGKVDLRLEQKLTDLIVPHHRLAIDLRDGYKTVAIGYGSGKDAEALETLPSDAVKASLSLNAFTDVAEDGTSLLSRLFGSVMSFDDRFGRLTASFAKEGATSLLSRVTGGEISALLEKTDLLKTADIHDSNGDTLVVINGSALGMENDITVRIGYAANSESAEGGIASLGIAMKLGEKDIEVTLDEIKAVAVNEQTQKDFANFAEEEFHDISYVAELAEYAVGTLSLGTVAAEDEEGHKTVSGISYYGIEGDLAVVIGPHTLRLGLFDAYASVEGAETKIYANLGNLPVIRGVNGPDSDIYFRPNEAEGVRSSSIYYYANGIDPKGEALLTRDSSYGRVRNVRDAVRLDGEQFTGDLLGWLGRYSLGIVDGLLDGEAKKAPAAPGRHYRAGILGNEALRIETVLNGFTKSTNAGVDIYTISVNLGALLGIPVLGEANISLIGQTVHNDNGSFKTLTGVNVHAEGVANANASSMKLASVDVDLRLNNIHNGVMENVWEYPHNADYAKYFVKDVADDGVLTDASTGLLYSLVDAQFQNPDEGETDIYGHNYVGKDIAKACNLYLGL